MSLYIGLMSGTSIDGIDAVCVDFKGPAPVIISTISQNFDPSLAAQLHRLCQGDQPDEINQMADASIKLAHAYSLITQRLLKQAQIHPQQIQTIGCHGQTIRHFPTLGFSLQVGSPSHLAAMTGIDVIADFRNMDMALGGQGAPLVPAFHQACFASTHLSRFILNLGGIANVSCLIPGQPLLGYDIGPANTLLDYWFRRHHDSLDFDTDAQWAMTGKVNSKLLEHFLECDYLRLPPPKSTGRELFSPQWLDDCLKTYNHVTPADIQYTLTEFSATSIANALRTHSHVGEVYLCGGGTFNPLLVSRLRALLPDYPIATTSSLGIAPQWVEACAFAWLAYRHLEGKSGNVPSVTGARCPAILGAHYPAP